MPLAGEVTCTHPMLTRMKKEFDISMSADPHIILFSIKKRKTLNRPNSLIRWQSIHLKVPLTIICSAMFVELGCQKKNIFNKKIEHI